MALYRNSQSLPLPVILILLILIVILVYLYRQVHWYTTEEEQMNNFKNPSYYAVQDHPYDTKFHPPL